MRCPVFDVSARILGTPWCEADVYPEDIVYFESILRRRGIIEVGDLDARQRKIDLLSDCEPLIRLLFGSNCGLWRCIADHGAIRCRLRGSTQLLRSSLTFAVPKPKVDPPTNLAIWVGFDIESAIRVARPRPHLGQELDAVSSRCQRLPTISDSQFASGAA